MRDKGFIAVHRGGILSPDNHRKLIHWARLCAEHILPLINNQIDARLANALRVAKKWENGNVKTGDAMTASRRANDAAKESTDAVYTAVARCMGPPPT